ncbi:SPOR domain-containing protein [Agrobacterium rosae]|uniref:SPOR domain-containing protein n=1 Tax=Agrobacterium rosae TaxID=1972867 RepID=A0AAE5VQ17_9HYPH|nr:SPOR domain-containing protein [Agrobacterium rosae]KAA3512105.1 SPOR domain-containing protein [Agrobacterium rosae]KAA3520447.1 SPOR domain-containing protein [Agrobacterium rosae]MCM2432345.1 SPOR domain-containing protein [Agrobacterium rosae]MDX8331289.1 SPOR domain-containing protein [Agrobacterium rosae]MQB48701.1 SPOR domain-containing protein [Agrobacterium rosae]
MVEKNVAYNRDDRTEEFADNDPLAQLARLVGQEDRPSHVASPAAQHPAERREPEFNLEDELLREFAIYDAPRYEPVALDAANDVRSPVPANEFMQRVESVFARKEPELAPVEQYAPAETEEYLVAEHASDAAAMSNLRDDFRDDPDSVAALFDVAHRQSHQGPVVDQAPAYVEPISHAVVEQYVEQYEEPASEPVAYQPVSGEPVQHHPAPQAAQEPNWELMAETSGEVAIDLASELEMSVAEEVAPPVPSPPPIARRSSLDYSSLRLPLANFGAPRATPVVPQPVEPVIAQAPVAELFTQPLVAPANHVEPALPVGQKMSAMDELIYDVAKYEISNRDVSAATPVARMEPVVSAAPAVTVAAIVPPVAARVEPAFQQPVAKAEPDFGDFDTFKDDDFELALDDIDFDLDLSEIANIDVPVAPVAVAPAAPAPVQPKPVVTPTLAPVAAVVPRPQPVVAPPVVRQEAPRPVAPVVVAPPATLESLPFDPSQIGETEDQPETITEMEVPELPVGVFEPKPAPRRQEEDLDLDTELASLFTPAMTGGLDRNKNAAAARQPQPSQEEVDEFERALEQDFRRSMQEAAETRPSGDRAATTDISQAVRYSDEERGGARRWLVPMAAVLGVVLVGGGTYALMFGGSSSQGSNGAPVIIAADSEPTKVVPDNPGGRVVPNQDKAVYDRVAGGAPADPKQPSLISSSEQPVDVVQRTLIPEQLPLEGENDEMDATSSTPVGETEDPRLLSAQEKAQSAENQAGSPVNVSPRKVRTMIVKPDGTLVAQEVPAPAASAPQADKVDELAAPQAAGRTEGAPAVIAASRVPVAPEQPAQTPAPAAAAARPAQTAAPLPASRPAAQPANVVATVTNQGNVRPAPASQPAQETAAAPTAATNASSTGGYYVQVASLPSQAEAQKSYQNLSAKFGSVIGGRGVDIKAAEIAGKGTFYRVRIPAGDKNEAAALCERFRSAGGSCLVAR